MLLACLEFYKDMIPRCNTRPNFSLLWISRLKSHDPWQGSRDSKDTARFFWEGVHFFLTVQQICIIGMLVYFDKLSYYPLSTHTFLVFFTHLHIYLLIHFFHKWRSSFIRCSVRCSCITDCQSSLCTPRLGYLNARYPEDLMPSWRPGTPLPHKHLSASPWDG